MAYWLMKSEPTTYSIDDLAQARGKKGFWDGVRNYQARNFIRSMQPGDLAFFYHSSCKVPGIVGIVQVTQSPRPDETAFDPASAYFDPDSKPENPRWFGVDIQLVEKLPEIITLTELRHHPALSELQLLKRGNRLSVMPMTKVEWRVILDLHQ